jgi:hypothetical protein
VSGILGRQFLAGTAIGLGLALTLGAVNAAAKDYKYIGVKKCRSCHKKELIGDQYGKWREGAHAKAYETLKGKEALEVAKQKGLSQPPHESKECLKCHVTAYGVDARLVTKGVKQVDGVQCESCHGPGQGYRKKKIMSDRKKSVARGMLEPEKDEKLCTTCHNDESPSWDPTKFKLAGGGTVGFDFELAKEKIAHPIPEEVKGKYLELEKKLREEKKARGEPVDEEDEDE